MAKIAKSTDLTKLEGDPTARADVDHLPIESFQLRAWLGRKRGAGGVELTTRTSPRSALGTAIATVPLTIGGCASAVVLAEIGAPVWAASGGVLVPAGIFFGLRWAYGRYPKRLRRQR